LTVTEAAAAAEVSVRCARKWIGRYRAEGELGLLDFLGASMRGSRMTAEFGALRVALNNPQDDV
jgi:transposase